MAWSDALEGTIRDADQCFLLGYDQGGCRAQFAGDGGGD